MKMNRLQNLFGRKNDILSVYFTAGFPRLDDTVGIIEELDRQGADMVEIGIPFSDPMADGPVIQDSGTRALRNGMTLALLMRQVAEARRRVPAMPFVLMGYLNTMMQYGIERLYEDCLSAGIDALIVPDLPFADYMRDFKPLSDRYGIPVVMMITPETDDCRIRLIDRHCDGFIYMVSTASTTGTKDVFGPDQTEYFDRVNRLGLRHDRLIGFGISNQSTMADACRYSSGGIIGSLFIKCLAQHPDDIPAAVSTLMDTIGRR